MIHRLPACFIVCVVWAVAANGSPAGQMPPAASGLMCELMAEPALAEITDPQPEFAWIAPASDDGQMQTAYQILVASDTAMLAEDRADLWDSGRIASSRSTGVSYEGKPLPANGECFWKVRTWNENGQSSPYSQVQRLRTGALDTRYETIRYPLTTTQIAPARLICKGDGHYFVDFGKAAFGTVELTLTSPTDGHEVEIHLGEIPKDGDAIDREPGGSRRYRMIPLALKNGTHRYRVTMPPDKRNTGPQAVLMPESVGEVMPFRYLEVVNSPCPLKKSQVRQIAVHYPFDDDASRFTSSSEVLNDVWDLCKYSIKATSFCGVYVDGDRERIPYEGDAYINQLCHYSVDREYTMARYSHEYLITRPTWPTEWILHSVLMAWADYLYTGDADSIAHHYEDLKAKTLLALTREDGLISTQTGLVTDEVLRSIHFKGRLRDLVDWPHGETDDFEFRPINTVVNAYHYRALVLMSEIANALGKSEDAQDFSNAAARVRRSFNEKLLNRDKGIYVDGEGSKHSALHANMFPLAFGLVPDEHVASVAEFIKSRGMVCSVYGAQHLLDALYEAGEDRYALELMTDRDSDRSWPHMIYNVGTTITLEAWDNKYKPNQDWNHAWGAAPANIIPRRLMGVEPLEPGFAKVRIKPQVGDLKHGSLDQPTIRGTIRVRFTASTDRFTLHTTLPANVRARVYLPRMGSDSPNVAVDGTERRGRIHGKFIVLDDIPPGPHRFERTR